MKKFFMLLAFALFIWSALALVGILSWQAVLGCSIIYSAALFLQIKGKGGRTSMIGCIIIAVIATFLWAGGNDNIARMSFFGKLMNIGVVSCLTAVCVFMAVYAVKFVRDAIMDYYHNK